MAHRISHGLWPALGSCCGEEEYSLMCAMKVLGVRWVWGVGGLGWVQMDDK